MNKYNLMNLVLALVLIGLSALLLNQPPSIKVLTSNNYAVEEQKHKQESFWFLLHRKSNIEKLYLGVPGDENQSSQVKEFKVKTGVPGQKPTPLPELVGREYWLIIDKIDATDNPETAPYFLTLDVPVTEEEPYGPSPYAECVGQCNWEIPGAFGLHGVSGDETRLSEENPGSSGCVRHNDEDITYLYNLLNPQEYEIRYYIRDI